MQLLWVIANWWTLEKKYVVKCIIQAKCNEKNHLRETDYFIWLIVVLINAFIKPKGKSFSLRLNYFFLASV